MNSNENNFENQMNTNTMEQPVEMPTPVQETTPVQEPVQTTDASAPQKKKSSLIAVIVLVVALIILIVFGVSKLGLFSKDKNNNNDNNNNAITEGTLLEDIKINGHMCMGTSCSYYINGSEENNMYTSKIKNTETFDILREYDDYLKINIYYKEEKEGKVITGYEAFTKEGNQNVSDFKNENELREKIGLYTFGEHTDELTLKSEGYVGFGMSDEETYTYIEYAFKNNSGDEYDMIYKLKNGETTDSFNLEIDKKYNVTFDVVEGDYVIEYNIKEIK